MGVFIEAMKRLYSNGDVTKQKIIELFNSGKITEEEKNFILDVN